VRVTVPLPVLKAGIALVDTPGLSVDEAAAETAYRTLDRTDLAVMVLAADKILSAEERAAAAYIHDLLHGNVLFVVNRLDLIDVEDREDVLEWASVALHGLGNRLVGEPRILIAERTASASAERDPAAWLSAFSSSEQRHAVAVLSRASILERRLTVALQALEEERSQAARRADEARLRHLESTMRRRAAMRHAVAEARRRLETARTEIATLRAPFVTHCVRDTMAWIHANPRMTQVRLQLESAVASYTARVNEEAAAALLGAPVTAPPFDLRSWLFRLDLDSRPDRVGTIGSTIGDILTRPLDSGKSGREAGAALGSWISKNVLGKDAEGETERRIERLARATLTTIEAEVDRYFTRLSELLDGSDSFYGTWTESSAEVDAAEDEERRWAALIQWSQGFAHAARRTVNELLSA
jgi:hypothetical protein